VGVEYTSHEGVGFLIVTGELDMQSAPRLRELGEQALSDFTGTLRIDLSAVDFIDSTGIGALVAIKNKANNDRRTLILENPSERVVSTLDLTGLTEYFLIK
jgi:anti-sigma B factor antagonist